MPRNRAIDRWLLNAVYAKRPGLPESPRIEEGKASVSHT